MPQKTSGWFLEGPNKGKYWEAYREPSSPTGWTRKIYDPYRIDANGKPFESYEEWDAAAADVDEYQAAQRQQAYANQQASEAAQRAESAAKIRQAGISGGALAREAAYEDARRWDSTNDRADRESDSTMEERRARLKLAQRQFDEDRRQNDRSFGLDVARIENDTLKTGASMRGALNWIQGDMYAQGVSNGVSPYLRSLQGGTNVGYGGGTATSGNPTPLTVATMRGALGQNGSGNGGGSGGYDQYGRPKLSSDAQSFVNAVDQTARGGLANKGLSWWENQTRGQQDAYRSASDYLGRDTDSELEYYRRSRPGQRSAMRG